MSLLISFLPPPSLSPFTSPGSQRRLDRSLLSKITNSRWEEEEEPATARQVMDRVHMVLSWEEDRKIVLRIWSLGFSILATLMLFSTVDGRMAYVQGSYTGYVGFWTDCRSHKCASLGHVTVLIHMSQGFMILALALCLFLLPCMGLSFWSVFHRLNKIDSVFSFLGISIGLLILLSLTLFIVNCKMIQPRPQIFYQETFYSCWCACGLMLCAGTVSYLNQAGMWSTGECTTEWRMSYRRWTLHHSALLQGSQQKGTDETLGHTRVLPSPGTSQGES
ncbi:uncharacterized protein LOC106007870 isoform X2 [Heterocephalus glaber]|uniref:Uncharacterized protein LOC106007870 isoform X2 n=1 Tax=Heterocephalus glaber TaxID=10181 RepID=A0AAX6RZ10_HETGA|nr:uncharacterized protein LOC106007870 isoform X2 [Heterocephalus glaber]XP_021101528.1 uncharacterized protein LOC106007870 isoform X2 [Heterocephalus glaber]